MKCITAGCSNEASVDFETGGSFSHCSPCSNLSGMASGLVHLHRAYLGSGRWTEREVTAQPMGIAIVDNPRALLTFVCTFCGASETLDRDDYATVQIDERNAAAYSRAIAA